MRRDKRSDGWKTVSFSNAISFCKFTAYLFHIHHPVTGNLHSIPFDSITEEQQTGNVLTC